MARRARSLPTFLLAAVSRKLTERSGTEGLVPYLTSEAAEIKILIMIKIMIMIMIMNRMGMGDAKPSEEPSAIGSTPTLPDGLLWGSEYPLSGSKRFHTTKR
jgi:hypothetical protein